MLLWVALECTPYRRFVVDLYLSDAKNLWTVEVPKILNFLYGNAKGKLTSKDFLALSNLILCPNEIILDTLTHKTIDILSKSQQNPKITKQYQHNQCQVSGMFVDFSAK